MSLPLHLFEHSLRIPSGKRLELIKIAEPRLIYVDRSDDVAARIYVLPHARAQIGKVIACVSLRFSQRRRRPMARDQVNGIKRFNCSECLQPGALSENSMTPRMRPTYTMSPVKTMRSSGSHTKLSPGVWAGAGW